MKLKIGTLSFLFLSASLLTPLHRAATAAEPAYELSKAVSVNIGGQAVQLNAGQEVTVMSSAPNQNGNVMIKLVLPNGSLSMTQIPASSIRPKGSGPAPVAAVPPPAAPATASAPVAAAAPATASAPAAPVSAVTPVSNVTGGPGSPVPFYSNATQLDPDTIIDTPEAIITHVGDRARDRHAREWMFHAYDHYLKLYWENRTVQIEIIDRVAKGGDTITFNMTSLFQLNHPNLRMFFEGKGTVAQYTDNTVSKEIDSLHYTQTIKVNTNEHRPIKVGDRIEFEFSPFLKPPVEGRTNYYGTAMLYVVGQGGTQPWEWHTPIEQAHQEKGAALDSYPLPDIARLAGGLTLPEQYSDEPRARFQQVATNMAPIDIQPFMLGRRIHHTDMATGKHSEADNPIYTEMVGKLGPQFVSHSCISCHEFNGGAMPSAVGAPMLKYAIHVGTDAAGSPHPDLGYTLQTQTLGGGKSEGGITVSSWTEAPGTYGDGTTYSLQKPTYAFTGVIPRFFSVRLAPRLVGDGLLDSVDENAVMALASQPKPDGITGHVNVVKDPVTGQMRMGRFGWKASQASLTYQIAAAFNNDMGITTAIFPHRDRGANQPNMDPAPTQVADTGSSYQKIAFDPNQKPDVGPTVEIAPSDLGNLYRYIALLGVAPRRNFNDPDVIKGQALFAKANCNTCHMDTIKTSPYYPLAELRNQTIHPYTDLLVHDMGPGLADNMGEGKATGAEWRTPPLWSIGLAPGVTAGEAYLHDGRARNLSEAILWHGGEAEKAKERFRNMSADDRAALIKFLKSL